MKERPIIFNGDMVLAILDGRKTQTRRVVKPQIEPLGEKGFQWNGHTPGDRKKHGACCTNGHGGYEKVKEFLSIFMKKSCPYGVPGDLLWVREPFHSDVTQAEFEDAYGGSGVFYKATEIEPDIFKWKPSIHMFRWASRITLEVTKVRVERVQDISEKDAKAEGVNIRGLTGFDVPGAILDWQEGFYHLWNSINEKRGFGWDKNHWVWVIEFEVVK